MKTLEQVRLRALNMAIPCMLFTFSLCVSAKAATIGPDGAEIAAQEAVPSHQPGDGNPALILFTGSEYNIPSTGTITGANLYGGGAGSFSLLLLRPDGAGDIAGSEKYTVIDKVSGNATQAQTSISLDWATTSNDVLAYWGFAAGYNFSTSGSPTAGAFYGNADADGNSTTVATNPTYLETFTVAPQGTAGVDYVVSSYRDYTVNFSFVAAPEPGTITLLAGGALVLFGVRRYRSRNA